MVRKYSRVFVTILPQNLKKKIFERKEKSVLSKSLQNWESELFGKIEVIDIWEELSKEG